MGLEQLRRFLRRNRRIGLDTNVVVYHLEANQRYKPFTRVVFQELDSGRISAVTSTLTVTELLVPAYRDQDEQHVNDFYGLLSTYPNIEWRAPDLEIADLGAELRAAHNMRTPDAIYAATAIQGNATGFVTNDPVFQRVRQLETLVLDRLL